MRLIHDGLDFIQTGKRLVHHFPIGLEIEPAGGGYLEMVDTVMGRLAHGCAQRLRSISDYVWCRRSELQGIMRVCGARDIDDGPTRQDARTLEEAAVDG